VFKTSRNWGYLIRRPSGRHVVKTDLQEVGYGVMDLIEVPQDRDRWQALANVVMNLQVP
jgi:hypothetical protein